ncbi:MAG: polysaccharide deacetylase family protein [Candidatus Thorarchaeota archaeon]
MADNISVVLHWNTDYAEFPRKEFPTVVRKSYEPMIAALEDFTEGKVCFNITGHTFEYLQTNFPKLLDRIKGLVKSNTVEIVASGYSHPILPLLPRQRALIQIKDHIAQIKSLFNVHPKGFWPPELAVSPSVLAQIKSQGIDWIVADYEHFLLSQFFGNDANPFEMRDQTITELLVDAFWAKGLRKLQAYLRALRILKKAMADQIQPLQRIMINSESSTKAFLSSVSWTNSTQFAVGGAVSIYNIKKHFNAILKANTKYLSLYGSDIEFFGYRSLGPVPAKPVDFIAFLKKLQKNGIGVISPSDIPDEEWPKEPAYLSTGSWAPDKSFRIWTDSEDNTEFIRRTDEIYSKLSSLNWKKELMDKIEPYLRIFENSDPRGWAPIPERKNEAYSAIEKVFEILDKEK